MGMNFSRLASWLMCLVAVALPCSVWAQHLGVVTDLTGKAEITGSSKKLTILSQLDADTRVQLSEAARMVVVYLASGEEYAFRGPVRILFKADRPETSGGEQPEKRTTAFAKPGNELRIQPGGMVQAAIVMRGLTPASKLALLTLSGTKTLDPRPEFQWKALQAGLTYDFELMDASGRTLFESRVQDTTLALPPTVTLNAGTTYSWKVSTRLPDGTKYSGSGEFSIAPDSLRAQANSLRPAPDTPLSERVTYAAWLDTVELHDEARKYWRRATRERPEDPQLKALAAQ